LTILHIGNFVLTAGGRDDDGGAVQKLQTLVSKNLFTSWMTTMVEAVGHKYITII
jgi:hypothetical protein